MSDGAGSMPVANRPANAGRGNPIGTYFMTCATRPAATLADDPQLAERRAKVDRAFDRLEAACPRAFSPSGPYTVQIYGSLRRNYVNSDTELAEQDGMLGYEGWLLNGSIGLGKLDEILEGKIPVACRYLGGPRSVFAR
jgi:hypothetical protein